ncbi:hypothetical protein [Staphylococcus warneri]|uniref:hypothetical protein n=1 Tax=Staphylococcus warneri TaxID=1292 RepID=UPI0016436E18|nr:hypothetical protein [Staphylococcus warneri]
MSDGEYLSELLFSNEEEGSEREKKAWLGIFKETRCWVDRYFKEEGGQESIGIEG